MHVLGLYLRQSLVLHHLRAVQDNQPHHRKELQLDSRIHTIIQLKESLAVCAAMSGVPNEEILKVILEAEKGPFRHVRGVEWVVENSRLVEDFVQWMPQGVDGGAGRIHSEWKYQKIAGGLRSFVWDLPIWHSSTFCAREKFVWIFLLPISLRIASATPGSQSGNMEAIFGGHNAI